MSGPPDDEIVTIKSAASRLGMSQGTLRRLIRENAIWGAYLPNEDVGVRESEIQRFLATRPTKPKAKSNADCRRSPIVNVNCDNCGRRPKVLHRPRNEMGGYYCEDCCPVCRKRSTL